MKNDTNEALATVMLFLLCVIVGVHNFVLSPYLIAKTYNWYLVDFFGTASMSWHVGLGLSFIYDYLLWGVAKKKIEDGLPSVLSLLFNSGLALWLSFFMIWLLKDTNLFSM